MALLAHPFFHFQTLSKYRCFSCPESITYRILGIVIEVSAIFVAIMYFLVPSGSGSKILFWSVKGSEEYNSKIANGFEDGFFWVSINCSFPSAGCCTYSSSSSSSISCCKNFYLSSPCSRRIFISWISSFPVKNTSTSPSGRVLWILIHFLTAAFV